MGFVEIRRHFGFSTIELGRWVSKSEQQLAANLIYDALSDLALILNVPPLVIGLRESLNLAFGSGGRPMAQAHYAPGRRTLALAKNAGAGAFAHEFWHAFDHYIVNKAFVGGKGALFASDAWLKEYEMIDHPLNQLLHDVFKAVFLAENGASPSVLVSGAIKLDKQLGRSYYAQPTELMARAFESFVQDSRIKNEFLVAGTKQGEVAKVGGYPEAEQRWQIAEAFTRYFTLLGRYLEQQQSKVRR